MADVPNPFAAPTQFSNFVLIVEGKKLHVNKEYLSMHSPVFAGMFSGEFAVNEEEVEIKDIVYEEFVEFLNVIHPSLSPITASNVKYVLRYAAQFQMEGVMDKAEEFLKSARNVNTARKLLFAYMYHLDSLKQHCLDSFRSVEDIFALQNHLEYPILTEPIKLLLFDKLMALGERSGRH
ncbi:hypothetical protein PMAYCL1PPCAC_05360 [Pristionchus mayeri]|uniref:BTB domain-containing protein n=1 Tax=Pristionchus mayeri TaxID=1317129 RepID=A0AAN5C906_9BILA|nr:hypothetical protein PMAYCL1PPCAC_05360 [Pristionchus mayeri]